MMYRQIFRPILFRFSAHRAHRRILAFLRFVEKIPLGRQLLRLRYRKEFPALKQELFGLEFPNPVGLAAGFDTDGEYFNELSDLGFGFIEIGTLTPSPQSFTGDALNAIIPGQGAIVHRDIHANKGVLNAIDNIKARRPDGIVAANISYNRNTSDDGIERDLDTAFSLLYDFVDMFVFNISIAPHGQRSHLEDVSSLNEVMDTLLERRADMDEIKPVLLKISPDMQSDQVDAVLRYSMRYGIDGIVVGDAVMNRHGMLSGRFSSEDCHVSGAPVFEKSLAMVRHVKEVTLGRLPIVGVGGIMSPQQALEMFKAGASLIELYTGIMNEGPGLVKDILGFLDERKKAAEAAAATVEVPGNGTEESI